MVDLNEMADEHEKKEQALDGLAKLSQEMEKNRKEHEAANDAWWNGLTEKEREDAFYAVCKRIWQADGIDNGSFRHGIYDVFGFDPGDGEELQKMKSVTRFEVIDDTGRAYVKYRDKDEKIKYCLQDDDRTLKVFIDKRDNL